MKNIKYIFFGGAALVLFSLSSCKKTFFTDVNKNPNSPAAIPPATALTAAEVGLGYSVGGDMSRYTSLFTQQTLGLARQSQAYYQYTFTEQDMDNLWLNLYVQTMTNLNNLQTLADAGKYHEYSGVARALLAYTLQMTVDCWGKIPYSEAFKGVANFHPKYDSDADVYAAIGTLCDDAITELNNTDPGALTPSTDDLVYGGDATEWIKFVHAVKARLAIHQSKNNPAMATTALNEIAASFTANTDNAAVVFGGSETNAASWYQFNEQRGDIDFPSSSLSADMKANLDPRYTMYFDSTYNDINFVGMGTYFQNPDAPVELITYDEIEMIKAEAIIRSGGGAALAQTEFQAGIQASMDKLGVAAPDAAAYIAAHGTLTAGN